MMERSITLRGPLDLGRTLWPLRHGLGDRTVRLLRDEAWLAARTTGRRGRGSRASTRLTGRGPGLG